MAALASAAIIRPFQSASTLSSQPGRSRPARRSSRIVRSVASRASSGASSVPGGSSRLRIVFPSPIAARRHVVDRLEVGRVRAEQLVDLGLVPDVELAFLALGIGIQRARECALARAHLAQDPGHGLCRAGGEERLACLLPDMAKQVEKLGVVIEHLLEMGREPALVGGVAGEAAAQMIVDAALAHALHAQHDGGLHQQRLGSHVAAPEKLQHGTLRELRRAANATVVSVDLAQQSPGHVLGLCLGHGLAWLAAGESLQRFDQRCSVFVHFVAVAAIGLLDQAQHILEAGPAEARLQREVGAAPEGLGLGGEEHGERPAPLLAHEGERALVDGVEVGAFFAVQLDVDEELVHQRCRLIVLEALVGHDVAPVAGGIADREQDGLVGRLRLGQRVRSPRAPVHRIVAVLQEIGAGFGAQKVLAHGPSRLVRAARQRGGLAPEHRAPCHAPPARWRVSLGECGTRNLFKGRPPEYGRGRQPGASPTAAWCCERGSP